MARRRGPSQLDRIERQTSKIAAHVYGGLDPDTGEPVVSHRERLAKIEESMRREDGAKKWRRVRALVTETTRLAAAALAGLAGGHAGK